MSLDVTHYRPRRELFNIVQSFFVMEYDKDEERPDYLLPSGRAAFFYMEAEPEFHIEFVGANKKSIVKNGFYLAYIDNAVKYTHRRMRVVGVSIYPIYLGLVFRIKPKDIMNSFTRLDKINEEINDILTTDLEKLTISSIIFRMENYILSELSKNPLRNDVELVYQRIVKNRAYALTVADLASWMGYSQRHIINLFIDHIGLSPKRFIQLVRFSESLKLIDGMNSTLKLADVAFEMGYHDQAHFIREFKKLCGKTPTQIKNEKKSGAYLLRQGL
jgi:AraC-like DNA-binding protein